MSENWSDDRPLQPEAEDESVAWQSNGRAPDDGADSAATTDAVALAEEIQTGEPVDGGDGMTDEPATFLAELAKAMQATAGQERARVVDDTERRRVSHVEQIRAREKAEAARMRELADEDMAGIDAWADAEIARIQADREHRAEALRADLETSLDQHKEQIAQEIEGVESAIAAYRADVDAFFDTLEGQTDPVSIAQVATRRPTFPSLDDLTFVGDAPTSATVESGPGEAEATEAVAADAVASDTVASEPVAIEAAAAAEPAAAEPAATEAVASEPFANESTETDAGRETETVAETPTEAYAADAPEPAVAAAEGLRADAESSDDASEERVPAEPLVGVMDAGTASTLADSPWRDLPEHAADLAPVGAQASPTETPETEATAAETGDDSTAAEAGAVESSPPRSSVLQAVPALRPMGSWWGRRGDAERGEGRD